MLKGNFNHFVCDQCQEESVVDFFPDKWIWLYRNGKIEHRCGECKTQSETKEWLKRLEKVPKFI